MAFYGSGYIVLDDNDIFIDPVRCVSDVNTFERGLGVPTNLPTAPVEDGQLYLRNGYSAPVPADFDVDTNRVVYHPGTNVMTGHNEK
jgi:hypothetical protein